MLVGGQGSAGVYAPVGPASFCAPVSGYGAGVYPCGRSDTNRAILTRTMLRSRKMRRLADRRVKHPLRRRTGRVVLAEGKKAKQAQRERWDRAVVAVWSATRRDADLSQQALAQKLGWSRDTVASVEAGRRKVEVSDVILFAAALGLEPETIFRRILRW